MEARTLRNSLIKPKGRWTIEEIRSGFDEFYRIHKRYPTAHEIDEFEFLPTSRSIQRSFGGLVKLRTELLPQAISNFTSGEFRSNEASKFYLRAREYEEVFYRTLCKSIDELFVHEHKIMRPGRVCCDFFIYTSRQAGICIDLFYAKDSHSIQGIIIYKAKVYTNVKAPVLLVVLGEKDKVSQDVINKIIKNKKNPLPMHIKVISETVFWDNYLPYIKKKTLLSIQRQQVHK